jgi:predicted phosphohydrolase
MKHAFSVQFVSDVHLETRSERDAEAIIADLTRHAPMLILAGDIGNPAHPSYARFLSAAAARFDLVVIIAGNHEFYGSSLAETLAQIRAVARVFPNVIFLHNERFSSASLPVHIFGGTMWSDVSREEEARVERILSDHARIAGFSASSARNEHALFADLLEAEMAACEGTGKPFLVVSHHLPLTSLVDERYRDSGINSAFASDVRLARDPRIAAWIYGHTHTARYGPRFFCNPVGYPGENKAATLDRVLEFFVPEPSPTAAKGSSGASVEGTLAAGPSHGPPSRSEG